MQQVQNRRKRVKRSGQIEPVFGDMQTYQYGVRPDDQAIHGQTGEWHRLAAVMMCFVCNGTHALLLVMVTWLIAMRHRLAAVMTCAVGNGTRDLLLGMVTWLTVMTDITRVPIPVGCHATLASSSFILLGML